MNPLANRLAKLAIVAGVVLAPLAGCMHPPMHGMERLSAKEMKEICAAEKNPVDVILLSGDAIRGVKMLGWTRMGDKVALAVETDAEKHILIRSDQIQAILLDSHGKEAEDGAKSEGTATMPAATQK